MWLDVLSHRFAALQRWCFFWPAIKEFFTLVRRIWDSTNILELLTTCSFLLAPAPI